MALLLVQKSLMRGGGEYFHKNVEKYEKPKIYV